MSNKLAVKWGLIIVILLGALYLIYPNYEWYSKPLAEREKLDTLGERPKRMLNLGLDLRGFGLGFTRGFQFTLRIRRIQIAGQRTAPRSHGPRH